MELSIKNRSTTHSQSEKNEGRIFLFQIWIKQKWIKLKHWEYWPIKVVYFIPSIYFLYLGLRERSLLFFTASNPSIETGGMFFESKWSIFKRLPKQLYPETIFISVDDPFDFVLKKLEGTEIKFPLIAKPDRGERGRGVRLIENLNELALYHKHNRVDFLIQEFVNLSVELSVFYYRKPGKTHGKITSLTGKELLSVEGDGISEVNSLIINNQRALLQYHTLRNTLGKAIYEVLPTGKVENLVPYGNHCRGAKFVDLCSSISPALTKVFDEIAKSVDGFYFGRFDVRCESLNELAMGRNFYILELNGAGAEPAHIYHPGYSFFKGQKVLIDHFEMMHEAGVENHNNGVPYMSFKEFRRLWAAQKEYRKKLTWL